MANVTYNKGKQQFLNGSIIPGTDTLKVALVTSTYTPAVTHNFFSDITNEVTGTGYTAGGAALASVTVTQDDVNNRGVLDAADVTWASSTITARGAVLYKDTGTASTSPLIAYFDFTTDKSSSASDFTIQWHADGIYYIG